MFWLWRKLRGHGTSDLESRHFLGEIGVWAAIIVFAMLAFNWASTFWIQAPTEQELAEDAARDAYFELRPSTLSQYSSDYKICPVNVCTLAFANDNAQNQICNHVDDKLLCRNFDTGPDRTFDIAFHHVDGDEFPHILLAHKHSIVVCHYDESSLGDHHCNEDSAFSTGEHINVSILSDDLNSDGLREIVLIHLDGARVCALTSSGLVCSPVVPMDGTNWNASTGDVLGDETKEIAIANSEQSKLCTYNTANDQPLSCSNFDSFQTARDILLADLDGDSDLDVLYSGLNLRSCINNEGRFSECTPILGFEGSVIGLIASLAVADLDGDQDLDLITSGGTPLYDPMYRHPELTNPNFFQTRASSLKYNAPKICENRSGDFQCAILDGIGFSARDVVLGDIDGDQDIDVVFANRVWSWTNDLIEMTSGSNSRWQDYEASNRVCINRDKSKLEFVCMPTTHRYVDTWGVAFYPKTLSP